MDNDDTVYLHSICHMEYPTWCSYKDGILTIECSVCKRFIASFKAELIDDDNLGKDN